VGCRQRDARGALLRFVVRDEAPRLVPDPRHRLPGKGVSVHPRRSCLARAVRKGGFARALGGKNDVDLDALCALIATRYAERIDGLLLAARRTGATTLGTDATRSALHGESAHAVVLAEDAEGRRGEIVALAGRVGVTVVHHGTKERLGRLMGRADLGVLAIHDPRIASELVAVAARAQDLSEAE